MISQHEYLESEILAALIGRETSFYASLSEVDRHSNAVQQFWSQVETSLLKIVPSMSLNVLQHLRDKIWFEDNQNSSLQSIFKKAGKQLLHAVGSHAHPKEDCHDFNKDDLQSWRWHTFAFPAELLLSTSFEHGVNEIQLQHHLIQQEFIDKGFAETHLHQGAAINFPMFWVSALRQLASDNIKPDSLKSPGATFNRGREMAPWLLRGAIMRQLLCGYISQQSPVREKNFEAYLAKVTEQLSCLENYDAGWILNRVIESLKAPFLHPPSDSNFRAEQALYQLLIPPKSGLPNNMAELWGYDPIAQFPAPTQPQHKEIYFIREIFSHLENNEDRVLSQLLWQTLRLKTLLYRHIVQRPMVTGLQWFIRFYDRLDPLDGLLKKVTLESAFYLSGGGRGLKALEVRKSPKPDTSEMKSIVKSQLNSWLSVHETKDTELAMVLHLSKTKGHNINAVMPFKLEGGHADPANPRNYGHCRYGHYFRSKISEINAIEALLEQAPLCLYLLRGIDTCTDELSIPNWVMAPLIQRLEHIGNTTSKILSHKYPQFHIPGFRKTIHMGEDFCHLMDGIRHIDETITHYPLNVGDRIGHGLALGLEPEYWSNKHPVVWMPLEERLWNLVWEYQIYSYGKIDVSPERHARISKEIENLSTQLFGSVDTPKNRQESMVDLYTDLFSFRTLVQVGFPEGESFLKNAESRHNLLNLYLTSSRHFERSQKSVEIRMSKDEREALKNLQNHVRKRVQEKEITIEVNPSSNFLIADLKELKHHPIWHLNPVSPLSPTEPIRIAVGSDDPITFSTKLPDEYLLLNNVMKYMDVSPLEASNWLNQVRQNGLNARFSLPPQPIQKDRRFLWHQILKELED